MDGKNMYPCILNSAEWRNYEISMSRTDAWLMGPRYSRYCMWEGYFLPSTWADYTRAAKSMEIHKSKPDSGVLLQNSASLPNDRLLNWF